LSRDLGLALPGVAQTGAMIGCMPVSVLVIDDDPMFRVLARRILAGAGLTVIAEAESIASTIAILRHLRPAAALVDVNLPDGNGIALARELAALPWRPRVLLTSTDPDAASPDAVRSAGADGFVPKDELPNVPLERLLAAA
jgi:DNA-binding NarL/FixJ family response regulator